MNTTETATTHLGANADIELTVRWRVVRHPGRLYLPNGDPGYPPEEDRVMIDATYTVDGAIIEGIDDVRVALALRGEDLDALAHDLETEAEEEEAPE